MITSHTRFNRLRRLLLGAVPAAALALSALPAAAQTAAPAPADWPRQPVKLVVPFPPGGGTDLLAREIAQRLSKPFGQPFVVENKPGAGAAVGIEAAARATDGHTILFTSSNFVTVPALNPKVRFDVVKDFKPVTLAAGQASVLAVHPGIPGATLAEAIAHIKANPGKYNYGSAGIGSGQHLSTEHLRAQTGIDVVHIPLQGQGQMITEMLGGRVHLNFLVLSTALPHFRSGAIRPLGVSEAERSPFAPDIPTIQEAGVPDFVLRSWLGALVPANVPDTVVERLHREIVALNADPEFKAKADTAGFTLIGSTPAAFAAVIRDDLALWSRIARTAGAVVN